MEFGLVRWDTALSHSVLRYRHPEKSDNRPSAHRLDGAAICKKPCSIRAGLPHGTDRMLEFARLPTHRPIPRRVAIPVPPQPSRPTLSLRMRLPPEHHLRKLGHFPLRERYPHCPVRSKVEKSSTIVSVSMPTHAPDRRFPPPSLACFIAPTSRSPLWLGLKINT